MDQARVDQLQRELQEKTRLANEQIRRAEEEYARKMEIERNRDSETIGQGR